MSSIPDLFYQLTFWFFETAYSIKKHTRVQPGALKLKAWPTTVMGLKKRYEMISSIRTDFASSLTWHFVLLVIGTIYNPDQEYFYDNLWADLVLNDGTPKSGPYQYVDLFTWRGWIETAMTIAVTNMLN